MPFDKKKTHKRIVPTYFFQAVPCSNHST